MTNVEADVRAGRRPRKLSQVKLRFWEEVRGVLTSVSEKDDFLKFVLKTRPVLLGVWVPREILVGEVPNVGNDVSLLRTDRGYRIALLQSILSV